MRRTERLFQIIQVLRSRRRPITGNALADELAVSLRTLYRDIAELMAQRVPIRGEAGVGYILDKSSYDMPPLMLTPDELEAAVLGAAWVAQRGDGALARGARDLLAKLTEAIPDDLRPIVLDAALTPLSVTGIEEDSCDVAPIRAAIRGHTKLEIDYRDLQGATTHRRVWPIAMAYTEQHRVVAAWCELRDDFRHFRTDRVLRCIPTNDPVPVSINRLRTQWKMRLKTRQCAPVDS